MRVVIVSGGFDPIHQGHIRYLEEAKKLGDILVVILNGDSFLIRKKGYFVFNSAERKVILEAIRWVDRVYIYNSEKDDVIGALEELKKQYPTEEVIFAKGGDRRPDGVPIPEESYCFANGIKVIYGVGGTDKPNSSSWVIDKILSIKKVCNCGGECGKD